jgi:hypothetical protein
MDFHEEGAEQTNPERATARRAGSLGADRLARIRHRILDGTYDSEATAGQVARRLLGSGDLD